MKNYLRYIVVGVLVFTFAGLISFEFAYAYLSDQAQSSNNTFTSAAQFPVTPPVTSFQTVVINEIMWMGSNIDSNDEWLELRNTTTNAISLVGWKLQGVTSSTLSLNSGIIPANGFYLITHLTKASSLINVDPDLTVTNLQINNSNLQIILRDNLNNIIDIADDGSGAPLRGVNSPTPKKSMSRNAIPGDGTVIGSWFNANSQANLDSGASESATPKAAN